MKAGGKVCLMLGERCIEGWGKGVLKAGGKVCLRLGEWCTEGWGEAIVRCLQEICTHYGMEDRCAPVDCRVLSWYVIGQQ